MTSRLALPQDPLALSAGVLPRLGWAMLVAAALWGAVFWALSA
ncbi:hypothetical protein [Pararoseomonas baculiformis]|nr:hypothetical protein [Pararoseomonas baculiformis]